MVAKPNLHFFKTLKGIKCFEKINEQDSCGKLLKFSKMSDIKYQAGIITYIAAFDKT